jgi:hypothetical protein
MRVLDCGSPQQVGTGGRGIVPQRIREEPTIGQQQHVGAQDIEQRLGQQRFAITMAVLRAAMDPGDGDPGRRGVPFAPTATPLEQVGALRRVGEWL